MKSSKLNKIHIIVWVSVIICLAIVAGKICWDEDGAPKAAPVARAAAPALTPKIYMSKGVAAMQSIDDYSKDRDGTWSLYVTSGSSYNSKERTKWTPYVLGTQLQGTSHIIRLRVSNDKTNWDQCQEWNWNYKGYVFVFSENDYGNCK